MRSVYKLTGRTFEHEGQIDWQDGTICCIDFGFVLKQVPISIMQPDEALKKFDSFVFRTTDAHLRNLIDKKVEIRLKLMLSAWRFISISGRAQEITVECLANHMSDFAKKEGWLWNGLANDWKGAPTKAPKFQVSQSSIGAYAVQVVRQLNSGDIHATVLPPLRPNRSKS